MFNSSLLLAFYNEHQDIPHVSKYHHESYVQHALLVVDEMSKLTSDSTLLLAAALHDIAKPRTQGINKLGEPCFYGHEEISDDELSQFLSEDDSRYEQVKRLIRCHMAPYKIIEQAKFDKTLRKMCRKIIGEEPTEEFISQVMLLHQADDAGSVRCEADMEEVELRCMQGEKILRMIR